MAAVAQGEVEPRKTGIIYEKEEPQFYKGKPWLPESERVKTDLHRALEASDVAAVKAILAEKPSQEVLDARDICGNTALHIAARCRANEFETTSARMEICELLLAAGASVTEVDQFGATALHIAAMTANPDGGYEQEFGPKKRRGGCVELLCDGGAKVDVPEPNFGNTPLHWAALVGMTFPVKAMLKMPEAKACLKLKNKEGLTPKQVAESKPNSRDAMLLIQAAERGK